MSSDHIHAEIRRLADERPSNWTGKVIRLVAVYLKEGDTLQTREQMLRALNGE